VPGGNGKLGAVGFCWGGGMVNTLATRLPDLNAIVPFYGQAPAIDQVPKIKAAVLPMFADEDERINATWPAYDAALKAAGVRYAAFRYPGTQHGLQQRHHAALRRQCRQARLAAHARLLQPGAAPLSARAGPPRPAPAVSGSCGPCPSF
jgi:carboxymethylenebutenolidase